MKNPFRYGCVVTGNDFCDRPQLINQLSEHIKAGQNVVMYGERRVGKSSLAKQTILTSKGVRPVLIDFMGINLFTRKKCIRKLCEDHNRTAI